MKAQWKELDEAYGSLVQPDTWHYSFDRYGGGGSDRAFAIEMYGGRSYVIDRVRSPDPIKIPHLSVGVLGGVQPDKIPGILNTPDDGLISRILWAWPDVLPNGSQLATSWPKPDLSYLGTGRRAAPEFPADLLGPFWAAWTERSAAAASSPLDYVGAALLAGVGAALANVRRPSAGTGWTEPPIIWMAVVGPPSSSKSPGMDAAFELVRHAEELMASGFEGVCRGYETQKQIAKAKREAWEKEVAAALKSVGTAPPMPEDAVTPNEPMRPRIRVADVTTERLGALAAGLPRGLLLVRDELSGWLGRPKLGTPRSSTSRLTSISFALLAGRANEGNVLASSASRPKKSS